MIPIRTKVSFVALKSILSNNVCIKISLKLLFEQDKNKQFEHLAIFFVVFAPKKGHFSRIQDFIVFKADTRVLAHNLFFFMYGTQTPQNKVGFYFKIC